jgi:hypothetical protein
VLAVVPRKSVEIERERASASVSKCLACHGDADDDAKT